MMESRIKLAEIIAIKDSGFYEQLDLRCNRWCSKRIKSWSFNHDSHAGYEIFRRGAIGVML